MWVASRAGARESKRERARNLWIRSRSVSRSSHVYCKFFATYYCNSPLAHKLTSLPAALSLETPARWSRSPSSFHLSPSSLKSPSVLFSPSFPPYLPIILFPSSILLPPLSHLLSLSLPLPLYVSRSLCRYFPRWCCPLRATDCLWVSAEQERVEPITAMQSNQTTSRALQQQQQRAAAAASSRRVCLHVRSHVRLVYTFKNWTLFTWEACVHLFCFFPQRWYDDVNVYACSCVCVCVCVCVWAMTRLHRQLFVMPKHQSFLWAMHRDF